jgi:hypothetical protein
MQIHDQLRALRGDDTPQRDAQARMFRARDGWLARPGVAEVMADMAAFDTSRPLAECPALAALFDEESPVAADFVRHFIASTAQALADDPLGHVALRHFTDGTNSTLLLARSGQIALTLVAIDGERLKRQPAPLSVTFSPIEQWEKIISGTARAELVERRQSGPQDVSLGSRAITLSPGRIVSRDCLRQCLILREADGCLVTLRLQRRRKTLEPTREYELASGKLVHQAASDPRDSRFELMLALLGRMGRAEAAPLMAELALEQASSGLRWQALRECLGLDTLTGFRALTTMACSTEDPLARAAGALRSQLIEAHPQLAEVA